MTKTRDNTHYCSPGELRLTISHLKSQSIYFVAGTSSVYVPQGRARYVDKTQCKPWPDLEGQVRLQTPGAAARCELMREWPNLKRVGWHGEQVKLLSKTPPMLYTGPAVEEMVYIDLEGAYSQIYERLWLDTSYPRGLYGVYPLWDVAQRLKIWKVARNSLVGITRSTGAVAYRGTTRINLKTANKYLSPGLWATVQSILHWVMSKAIDSGAIYGNVDGYIFPTDSRNAAEEFGGWLSSRDIRWSIRASGAGQIVGWNNYQIGSTRTKLNELGLTHKSKEFNNVNRNDPQKWASYWRACTTIARARRDAPDRERAREANLR